MTEQFAVDFIGSGNIGLVDVSAYDDLFTFSGLTYATMHRWFMDVWDKHARGLQLRKGLQGLFDKYPNAPLSNVFSVYEDDEERGFKYN